MRDPASYPRVEIIDETMREGMQIESAAIPVRRKADLLNALSNTGLSTIVVGSFVSPKYTPQMAEIDDLLKLMEPVEGVRYLALALNQRGRERLLEHSPPLDADDRWARSLVHLCDVFVQRNANRTQAEEIAAVPIAVERAVAAGATEAMIAVNAAWGSNWLGDFTEDQRTELLQYQYDQWTSAGIAVTGVWLGDPMGWNLPHVVRSQLAVVGQLFPAVRTIHLHLHDARGTAMLSAFAALEALDATHTLILDAAVGGMGGCPYSGHGRFTRMIATEDLVDLLEELGLSTGVDLDRLIEVAHLAEDVVGHDLWGRVSQAGPRPRGGRRFPMDLPAIETPGEAQHFRSGPSVYAGARRPWAVRIVSGGRPE